MPEALLFPAIRRRSIPPLLLISLAVTGSPGPATVSLVAMGSVLGARHALKYLIAIVVGTTVFVVAVATGITAALVALPAIGSVLLGISAAYSLWLADHIATEPLASEQTAAADTSSLAGGALHGAADRGGRTPCRPSPAGSRSSLSPALSRANYAAIGSCGVEPIAPGSDRMNVTRLPRTTCAPQRGL
jgi:hypothetical protein